MIEVFLVDNDRFASAGLRQHLDEASDIQIVGSADSGEMALEMLEVLEDQLPQMILARARLPGLTGIQVAMEIRERGWPIKVLVCCLVKDPDSVEALMRSGVTGYFLRDEEAPENIVAAVRAVAAGERWYSPTIKKMLDDRHLPEGRLTQRQVEILALVERGLTNQGIAQELGVRKRTIDFQIERILESLNAKNRAEASAIARRRGWLR